MHPLSQPDPPTGCAPRRRWIGRGAALLLLLVLGAVLGLPGGLLQPALLELESPPAEGGDIGPQGLPILVRFPRDGRARPATFRAWLNGADVTDQLAVATNGCEGVLHGLLDGENDLRLEVFGRVRALPAGWLIRQERTLRVSFHHPVAWDRG